MEQRRMVAGQPAEGMPRRLAAVRVVKNRCDGQVPLRRRHRRRQRKAAEPVDGQDRRRQQERLAQKVSELGYPRVGFEVDALDVGRSEEHTSELQSLMRISYAVFCLKKKKLTE